MTRLFAHPAGGVAAARVALAVLLALAAPLALVATTGGARAATTVYVSDSTVQTWDPILPVSADSTWGTTTCKPGEPAVGLGAAWTNPHGAFDFGASAHPWQPRPTWNANWINS